MSRSLRVCLIFLLSLALPLSGMAGVQLASEPCPMQSMGMAMVDGMGPDCCQDMHTSADHGKPCKPGQECKSGGMLQVALNKPPVTLSSAVVLAFPRDTLPIASSSGVWRPPRV
ncbi:hypothetical protein [Pseudomonas fontis]|uniref:Uncharacterized protein n=1 Tax=Pseudomonas fontis TaxID=2942633 RepID=A0ABT5P0X7_9PSED|nr:hypothetical protein [Pseudomonas fontis]MDD0977541.1 hypothetical protein [Pseudomonas fontis]MDD0994060.1 hypothetical protein [Pseudomonas fontis]